MASSESFSRQTHAITASDSLTVKAACPFGAWLVSSRVSERFRSLVIFFVHECVCHKVMGRGLGIVLFRGEKEMSAGLAARTTASCFMRKGPPRRWDAARDNCLEKAQPSEADHQFARRVKVGIRRYGPASWFGRRSSPTEGVFVSTAGCSIAFSHASWKHGRGDCSATAMGLKPHCAVSNDTASVSAADHEAH